MTIRQELLKQAEDKLDGMLEQIKEEANALTDDGWVTTMLCRIISTDRNGSVRTAVIRKFANDAEAKIIATFNSQSDLDLGDQSETSGKKETL